MKEPLDKRFQIAPEKELLLRPGERNNQTNWLGTMSVWFSGISMLIYFFTSYGVKNHILFLIESFKKVILR